MVVMAEGGLTPGLYNARLIERPDWTAFPTPSPAYQAIQVGAQMARPTKDTPPKLPKSSKAASAAGSAKGRGGAAGAGHAMIEATGRATSKRPKRRRPTTR
jgi:hypothetical protein